MPPARPTQALTAEQRAEAAKHLGLARSVAAESKVRLDLDERFSVALEAICHAVTRFDPARNIKISTYLTATIRHELKRSSINQKLVRVPEYLYLANRTSRADCRARAEAASEVVSIEGDRGTFQPEAPDPDADGRDCEERSEWLRSAVAKLPDQLRDVIERRMAGATIADIGADLKISYATAHWRVNKAHAMLRVILSK